MDKDSILKKLSKIEDKLLVARILDKYVLFKKAKNITHSDFLDPYQRNLVDNSLSMGGIEDYHFYGGFYEAERALVVFCPYNMSHDCDDEFSKLLRVIRIDLKTRENFSHRDYLGSLLGLGIKREKIGDILVREEFCLVVVNFEIADYILYNLTRIGSAKALVQIVDKSELEKVEPKIKEINATVASLRLDSVASAGFNVSRSKVADFIRGEKVNVNWETVTSLTKLVKEGDTISIRGKGRVVLEKIGSTTNKDRIHVLLKKFV